MLPLNTESMGLLLKDIIYTVWCADLLRQCQLCPRPPETRKNGLYCPAPGGSKALGQTAGPAQGTEDTAHPWVTSSLAQLGPALWRTTQTRISPGCSSHYFKSGHLQGRTVRKSWSGRRARPGCWRGDTVALWGGSVLRAKSAGLGENHSYRHSLNCSLLCFTFEKRCHLS